MNENPVYNITKEQVLKMAEACPTAEKILKAGFPDAFKDEWMRVPSFEISIQDNFGLTLKHDGFHIFNIDPKPIGGISSREYIIENGQIWWRRRA